MASDFRLKEQLPQLTDHIVRTYDEVGKLNHLDHCPLPRYDAVVEAVSDLKEIIYPGYRRREGLHRANIVYHVGNLVDKLHDQLTTQIGRALRHEAGATSDCRRDSDYEALGQAKAIQFLEQLPRLRAVLAKDVQAAFDGDPACKTIE
jgi:serine O-acetyltransferase